MLVSGGKPYGHIFSQLPLRHFIIYFDWAYIPFMQEQHSTPEDLLKEIENLQQKNSALNARLSECASALATYQQREMNLKNTLKNESRIKAVLDQNSIVIIVDKNGVMTYVNDRFCELSQYSKEELLGQNANFVSSNYHSRTFFETLWKTISKGEVWQGEIRNRAKDGSYFWVDMVVTPLLDEWGKPQQYLGIRRDITQEKQSKDLLRFNAYILARVHDAIVGLDTAYRVNYWNHGAQRLYGLKAEEVLGKPLREAYQSIWINKEDEQRAMRQLSESGVCEVVIIHKLRTGKEIYVEATTQVLKNEMGKNSGLLAVIRDVTDRIQAEKDLNETLDELGKRNYELDNYVYKVSHDLKAPLSSMRGLLNLIKLEADSRAKAEYLDLIESRVVKLDDIILSILHQAKILKTETMNTLIDFKVLIDDCYEELKHYSHWEKINLSVRITGDVAFYSDEFRITVILRNIVSNAIKYLNLNLEQNYLNFEIKITRQEAQLTIRDNGIGIDAQFQSKIFDMFFRAASVSEGSGLGLYIVKQAVEKLGGLVRVESKSGLGTTFFIELPNYDPAQ